MADLSFIGDLSETQDYGNFDLPDGTYRVKIISDEVKQDKNGDNYLNLRYDVQEGTFAKACKFDALYLWLTPDTDKKANWLNMCKGKLKSIAKAIHHPNPNFVKSSSELLGGEMIIRLKTKVNKEGYENQNITSYKPVDGVAYAPASQPPKCPPPASAPVKQAPVAQATPPTENFPWES